MLYRLAIALGALILQVAASLLTSVLSHTAFRAPNQTSATVLALELLSLGLALTCGLAWIAACVPNHAPVRRRERRRARVARACLLAWALFMLASLLVGITRDSMAYPLALVSGIAVWAWLRVASAAARSVMEEKEMMREATCFSPQLDF